MSAEQPNDAAAGLQSRDSSAAAIPSLAYASGLTQAGVSIFRDTALLRMILPRRRFREFGIGWWVVTAILVLNAIWSMDEGGVPILQGGLLALLTVLALVMRLGRRTFEIAGPMLRVGLTCAGRTVWTREWPRTSVGEIKYVAHSGKLLIRITGQDMREYWLPGDAQLRYEVALALQQGLTAVEAQPNLRG